MGFIFKLCKLIYKLYLYSSFIYYFLFIYKFLYTFFLLFSIL